MWRISGLQQAQYHLELGSRFHALTADRLLLQTTFHQTKGFELGQRHVVALGGWVEEKFLLLAGLSLGRGVAVDELLNEPLLKLSDRGFTSGANGFCLCPAWNHCHPASRDSFC
jgi:hypothetical protein